MKNIIAFVIILSFFSILIYFSSNVDNTFELIYSGSFTSNDRFLLQRLDSNDLNDNEITTLCYDTEKAIESKGMKNYIKQQKKESFDFYKSTNFIDITLNIFMSDDQKANKVMNMVLSEFIGEKLFLKLNFIKKIKFGYLAHIDWEYELEKTTEKEFWKRNKTAHYANIFISLEDNFITLDRCR